MRDILDESLTHPKPFPLERYRRLLVLAAHPDDEVYGCGGLIALASGQGKEVRVHVAAGRGSDAAAAAVAETRRAESARAATILGCQIEFGAQVDRGMRLDSGWVAQLRELFVLYQPDLVLAPSLGDYHPDHQALALAAVRAFEAIAHQADLAFYETVGALGSPTHIVDVTTVYEVKRRAMACFASQERLLPYADSIEARDRFRALPLAPHARHAEVFHLAACRGTSGWGAVLPALADGVRQSLGALEHPAGAPLVSVLIRTIGDPRLLEAVASVAAQTYRPLEIVVAVADARDPWGVIERASRLPNVRVVSDGRTLSRPQAANLALHAARGDWLIFLDDDDYWLPSHLEGLVASAMHQAGSAMAVCAGVEVRDASGRLLRIYANNPDLRAMALTNQVPIHSVLFSRALVAQLGCRFDETLPILEDWDFWLQVLQHSPMLRTDAVTAVYRWSDRSRMFRDEELLRHTRRRIHDKWFERLGWGVYQAAIEHAHARIDAAEHEIVELTERVAGQEAQLAKLREQLLQEQAVVAGQEAQLTKLREQLLQEQAVVAGQEAQLAKLREQLLQAQAVVARQEAQLREQQLQAQVVGRELEAVRAELQAVLGSKSWRMTRPLRAARQRLALLAVGLAGILRRQAAQGRSSVSRDAPTSVFWSVDTFRCRGAVVFAYGWVLSATSLPVEVALEAEGGAPGTGDEGRGSPVRLTASLCQARPDVAHHFPHHPHAARSGFLLYGALPHPVAAGQAWGLRVRWPDRQDSWLPLQTGASPGGSGRLQRIARQARQLWRWARRAWAIGRSAGWATLIAKVKTRWRSHVAPQGGRAQLIESLRGLAGKQLAVIVDHALGGGANLFRRKLAQNHLEQGGVVVLYFFDVATLQPMVTVSCHDRQDSYAVDGFSDVLDALEGLAVRQVVYNTAASLPDAADIPWGLIELKRAFEAELLVYLHDYFPVCPSQYLLNDRGVYCGVPDDLAECARCLRSNAQGFAMLYPGVDMTRWRTAWGALLMAADRIVTFSRAACDIVLRAYPALAGERIEVVPHVVDHLPARKVRIRKGQRLTIGVVGTIGYHKGAGVVRDLCYHILDRGLPVRVVVIGTIDAVCPPGVLLETGPYRHEILPDLLEQHEVSLVLFPSIWPETFSYVVQELIVLGCPIAAFDLGAPAERLAAYPKGLLLREREPGPILQRLIDFWHSLPSDENP